MHLSAALWVGVGQEDQVVKAGVVEEIRGETEKALCVRVCMIALH